MSILKNKIDFVALVAVNGANPNGDPNAENMPRVDDEMYGEISSGCIHRKIRNRMQEDVYKRQVTYECAYSVHDNQPTFDIQFINADRNEDETEFTCESGQNIIQCLRELHHLFEDFKKENSGIKEVLKVMYVGTDTRRGK